MGKRTLCPQCQLPLVRCLCAHIVPIANHTGVFVLQHPSEQHHAKNTVRLLCQVLENSLCVVGETEADFTCLRQQLKAYQQVLLVYPSEDSQAIHHYLSPVHSLAKTPLSSPPRTTALLLLDGTWRKAYKLWQLNPWLQALPAVHLQVDGGGDYQIRQAKRPDSLSTLEAAAYCLQQLEPETELQPLFTVFTLMKQQFIAQMPAEVQARYAASANKVE